MAFILPLPAYPEHNQMDPDKKIEIVFDSEYGSSKDLSWKPKSGNAFTMSSDGMNNYRAICRKEHKSNS